MLNQIYNLVGKKVLSIIFVLAFSGMVVGQSVLEVPATEADGTPIINALIKFVVADTNEAGQQRHDIYKLQRGKTYFYNQSPVFQNPITLIADEPGTTNETKPPKIILTVDDAGEAPYEHCITTFADLTVKNIAFSTTTVDGAYSWANVILLQSDGLRLVLEGCHFELSGWGMLEANVNNTVFIINKCHLRNGTVYDYGDEWCPFFMEINAGTADTLIVRNTTFFNLQGTVINIETQNRIGYLEFDHNTLVNVVKGFSSAVHAHTNSKITNNIFYNVGTHSNSVAEIMTGDDKVMDGVITADTLSSNLPGSTLPFVMDEKDRVFHLKNNAYYFTQNVKDYWAHYDTILVREWLDPRAETMFNDNVNYPNFIAENNVNVDPGFVNFGGTDGMVFQLYSHRDNGTFGFWGWDPDSALYPDVHWAFLQWPLPEDLSYSASLTSTDGFHVGSLQYYPSELALYEQNITSVENVTGNIIPQEFALEQNYPNPFNPTTKIQFSVPNSGKFNVKVYDVLGRVVATLFDGELTAGVHQVSFDASNIASGMYVYKLSGENVNLVKKMVLLK